MASIQENRQFYNHYDWSSGGEEWADAWGGSDMQWYGTILPRIHLFLPAHTVLEIGAGHGRWAGYFLPYCEQLILVDLTTECVDVCRHKFASISKITCYQNDGTSLENISNNSVDFIFSFHSLVHCDEGAMQEYSCAIAQKLTDNGVAFIHHSNAGNYTYDITVNSEKLEDYRDITMTAEKMRNMCSEAGLRCSTQELINWETHELLDCFSVIAKPNSLWGRSSKTLRNPSFIDEMEYLGKLAELYGQGQTPATRPYLYQFFDNQHN